MPQADKCHLASAVSDITAVFSDIDGTLAHYAKTLGDLGYERLAEAPEAWDETEKVCEDAIDALLWECYPLSYRKKRFDSIPQQFWRHIASGRVLRTYELYNLSLTGAIISENTILLMELLQCTAKLYHGIPPPLAPTPKARRAREPVVCCLITGARTTTFARRRVGGSLPQTVYESCEGGVKLWCRIRDPASWFSDSDHGEEHGDSAFYPPRATDVPFDLQWTNRFGEVTGYYADKSAEENEKLRSNRKTMWTLEAALQKAGFATDHKDYDASFVVDIRRSPCIQSNYHAGADNSSPSELHFENAEEAEKFVVQQFREKYNAEYGVELFVNLGKGQVNAEGSGKRGVMLHVLDKAAEEDMKANSRPARGTRFCPEHSVALFDDENDLQFAELCGAGILPSVAHEEVLLHKEWTCEPSARKWFRPPIEGPLGSEWALKQIVTFKRQNAADQ